MMGPLESQFRDAMADPECLRFRVGVVDVRREPPPKAAMSVTAGGRCVYLAGRGVAGELRRCLRLLDQGVSCIMRAPPDPRSKRHPRRVIAPAGNVDPTGGTPVAIAAVG